MSTPFVRPYDPTRDFDHGLHVFLTTIDSALNHEPARTIGSHLWYIPYITLTPTTCFVLDDSTGRAVGYCIGCANTAAFAQRWRTEFAPTVDPVKVPKPGQKCNDEAMEKPDIKGFRRSVYEGECSMLQDWPGVLEKYPAHMHIDILPEWQKKGWGRKLIEAFFEEVKKDGAVGVHLGMVRHNVNARAFYERIGFEVCPQVLDEGASGEMGVNGIVATLVKRL